MIRQAELTDFGAITDIRHGVQLDTARLDDMDYRIQIQQGGFLLPTTLSVDRFQANLPDYSVAEHDGQIVGYAHLQGKQAMTPEEAIWLQPSLEGVYYTPPHGYLAGIGILPAAKRCGIGKEMLRAIEQQAQSQSIPWLFSMIVTSPVTNIASLVFHERNGFQRVALLQPTQECGMDGFQNLLYGKQLF